MKTAMSELLASQKCVSFQMCSGEILKYSLQLMIDGFCSPGLWLSFCILAVSCLYFTSI